MYNYLSLKTSFSYIKAFLLLAILFINIQCTSSRPDQDSVDYITSPTASQLAALTVDAMGGEDNWNNTRYIYWDFFGVRQLLWDKWTGNVRIDSYADSMTYLVNTNSDKGNIMKNGIVMSNPDSVDYYTNRGKRIWINDSYWLTMPFKLKDPGVTLAYLRKDSTKAGTSAFVVELRFDQVGVTPDNKYEIYIDENDYLVKQWSYFKLASQDTASATWPWDNYRRHGKIFLSSDRSDGKGPRDVRVFKELPDSLFTNFGSLKIDLYTTI